jgi:hypothetical protein
MLPHAFARNRRGELEEISSPEVHVCATYKNPFRHCGNCLLPFHSDVITLDTLGVQALYPV